MFALSMVKLEENITQIAPVLGKLFETILTS